MPRRFVLALTLSAAWLLIAVPTASADRAYFVRDGMLVWRDLESPTLFPVGAIRDDLGPITFDAEGLIGLADDGTLVRIDPRTAMTETLASIPFEDMLPIDLFVDDVDRLWALLGVRVDPDPFGTIELVEIALPDGTVSDPALTFAAESFLIAAAGDDLSITNEVVTFTTSTIRTLDLTTGVATGPGVPIAPGPEPGFLLQGGDTDGAGRFVALQLDQDSDPLRVRLRAIDIETGALTVFPGDYTVETAPRGVAIQPTTVIAIPTLGPTGLALLAAVLAICGAWIGRRRGATG